MRWNKQDIVNGFRVIDQDHIKEIGADAYVMQHIKSGAKLMYIDSEDDNKVFLYLL